MGDLARRGLGALPYSCATAPDSHRLRHCAPASGPKGTPTASVQLEAGIVARRRARVKNGKIRFPGKDLACAPAEMEDNHVRGRLDGGINEF